MTRVRRSRCIARAASLPLGLTLACGSAENALVEGSPDEDNRTLAVDTVLVDGSDAPLLRLSDDPVAQIGKVDGDAFHVLASVSYVTRLSDGSIAVFDSGSREIRYFDEAGRLLRAVGGRGGGPGEFEFFSRVVRGVGDTLLVLDENGVYPRTTLVHPGGELELLDSFRRFRLTRPSGFELHARLVDGSYVIVDRRAPSSGYEPGDTVRPRVHLGFMVADQSQFDTVASVPGPLRVYSVREFGPGRTTRGFLSVPLSDDVLVAANPEYTVVSRTSEAIYQVFGREGVLERVIVEREPQVRIIDHALLTRMRRHLDTPGELRGNFSEVSAPGIAHLQGLPLPRNERILVDGDRFLVERFVLPWERAGTRDFLVLHRDGRVLGRLRVRQDLEVHDVRGEFIAGERRGVYDTPIVEVYQIELAR